MKSEELIHASWFYTKDYEKIKLNWFIYELALMHFDHIEACQENAFKKWKTQRTDKQIAEFCAYFAKRMKPSWIDYLDGKTEIDEVRLCYISDYCHWNTKGETDIILQINGIATADLLATCKVCPCGCLSEPYMPCEFFDRMERGGYLR
jgi:hypothetical protein